MYIHTTRPLRSPSSWSRRKEPIPAASSWLAPAAHRPSALVLQWQRTAGNRAVQRRLDGGRAAAGTRRPGISTTVAAAVRRQPAGGAGQDPLLRLLEMGLEKGVGYGSDGWTVAGVPLKRFEQGAEVASKLLKGDVQGAVEIFKPRDPRERERIRQEMLALQRQFDLLVPGQERERERQAVVAEESRRLGLPTGPPEESRREPFTLPEVGLHAEEFRLGGTSVWILDRFRLESAALEPSHRRQLDDLARQAAADPGARIAIVGHTDTSGPAAFNLGLAERRGRAVRDYLQQKGVSGAIASVTGRGEAEPRVAEHTEDDRAQNRRVEIFFTGGVRERHPRLLRPPQPPRLFDLGG